MFCVFVVWCDRSWMEIVGNLKHFQKSINIKQFHSFQLVRESVACILRTVAYLSIQGTFKNLDSLKHIHKCTMREYVRAN